jgi:hypothetical protein
MGYDKNELLKIKRCPLHNPIISPMIYSLPSPQINYSTYNPLCNCCNDKVSDDNRDIVMPGYITSDPK